jgi:uncharacterized protein DUF4175
VSPDETRVHRLFARATRRALTLAIVEALAWGVAVATVSLPAGSAVAALVLAWRLRRAGRPQIVETIDRRTGAGLNVFVTADELLRGSLAAKPYVRERVFGDAARASADANLGSLFPISFALTALLVAAGAWMLTSTTFWRAPAARVARRVLSASSGSVAATGAVHVTTTTEPPSYTGEPPRTAVDPTEIAAIEGSALTVTVDAHSTAVTVDHDGAVRSLARGADGRFVDRIKLTRTGYYSIETTDGARRVTPIVVSPDALPSVRVSTPGRDLVFADANQRVAFEARARDDFGLRALSLHYTKVAGSGETFRFQEGEIPLAIARTNAREWRGTGAQSLADLHLEQGDMLVYRALAADNRPGAAPASSDAFFIEISGLAAGAADGFTIPQEETRYALSQQMLVVKTGRLDQRRGSMAAAEFGEAALNLAIEQRMIRAEFVFMLGGEIADEEVEAEQSSELQEGRLQNRGQRDLRDATVAMSQAEKLLTGSSTREALVAERAAITALQRAFARDRYILRALAGQTDLDPKRRLTGNLSAARNWRREVPAAQENRRAALLQDLLAGLGAIHDSTRSAQLVVLAGEALRLDPTSAVLRQAATDLQRIADRWPIAANDERRQSVAGVASVVARALSQTLAAAPLAPPFAAPSLTGAFADALVSRTKKSGPGGTR